MVKVQIEGAEALAKALSGLSTRLSKQIQREALIEGGERILRAVEDRAPREPGAPDLADNLALVPLRATSGRGEAAAGIGPTSRSFFYDYFQEFGTAYHSAQPFYRPALDTEATRAIGEIGQALWRELAGRGIFRPTVNAPGGLIGEV